MSKSTSIIDPAQSITAVVLAGGLGTRLRSVVADKPKVLAEVSGKPFLEYVLDQIVPTGITQVVLCIGHLAEQIQAHFGTSYRGLSIKYSHERSLLGTAGALRYALEHVSTENLLVMNGDSYAEFSFDAFASFHFSKHADASILLTQVNDARRYGQVTLCDDNAISTFEEKGLGQENGWINAGIYLIHRNLIQALPLGHSLSLEREVFPTWLGKSFFGFQAKDAVFIDIGTPQSFAAAQGLFNSTRDSAQG
jgi:NDP-sugar pyrophosphorylase family protein